MLSTNNTMRATGTVLLSDLRRTTLASPSPPNPHPGDCMRYSNNNIKAHLMEWLTNKDKGGLTPAEAQVIYMRSIGTPDIDIAETMDTSLQVVRNRAYIAGTKLDLNKLPNCVNCINNVKCKDYTKLPYWKTVTCDNHKVKP